MYRDDIAVSTNYNLLTGARSVNVSANQAFTIINKSFGTAGSLLVEGTTLTDSKLTIYVPQSNVSTESSYISGQYIKNVSSNVNNQISNQSNIVISYQSNNDIQPNIISSTSINSSTALLTNILVESETNKYVRIAGTVSSANAPYSGLPISSFASVPIANLASVTFNDSLSSVIGSGTNFVLDFSLGSVFLANNEYFKVTNIANTTYMLIDRFPTNSFSGVSAYKISI
jgi:hypothetical protein